MSRADPNRNIRWEMVKNTHGTDCPPYGLLKPTGVIDDVGRIECTRPDTDSDTSVMVNGANTIPAGMSGEATLHPITPVAYDTAETPGANEEWGSQSGSWLLTKDKQGFRIRGGDDGESVVAAREAGVGGGEESTYLLAATSTADSKGRYTSNEDTYDPSADSWTTSKSSVLAEPAIGVSMQKGLRYLAWPTGDPEVFTTIGDANEITVSSVPVYFGGLNNTTSQVFKGEKQYRDRMDWAWEKGAKSHSYLTTSSKGTRHHWQGPDCFASLDVESQRSFNFVGDGGTGYVLGGSVGASGPGGMAEVFQLPSSAGPPFVPPTAGLYAMAGYDTRTEFRIYASWLDTYMALCSASFTLANPTPERGRFGVTRDQRYYGIDALYDPTTQGLVILGGIVVGIYDLSSPPSWPLPPGDPLLRLASAPVNPYGSSIVAMNIAQQSYLDSVSSEDALYQQEYAEITGMTSPPKKTAGGPPPPPPPP